jgi:aromatic ring-opening dioxygenase catalytic subunit (LigB family)
MDGLGKMSPGLDHGVFIPFRRMFGLETDIPIVEVSIDSSFDPDTEWKIGQALDELRYV